MQEVYDFKVISSDGEIDLTIPSYVKEPYKFFDIFLHDTNIFIGYIWYDDLDDKEIVSYFGNVGYEIKKEYRGNNYALKALKMLKKIMVEKNIELMIFNIEKSNIYSKNVAKKLGARKVSTKKFKCDDEPHNGKNTYVNVYKCRLKKKGDLKWKENLKKVM